METTTENEGVLPWLVEYDIHVAHRNGSQYSTHVVDIIFGENYDDAIENGVRESVIQIMPKFVPTGPCSVEVEIYVCQDLWQIEIA